PPTTSSRPAPKTRPDPRHLGDPIAMERCRGSGFPEDAMTTHDDPQPTVAGPQSEAAVAPSDVHVPFLPTVLSEEQRRLLIVALDRIVPPRDGLPGAGGLGVDASIDRTLALTPTMRRLFLDGLAEITRLAERQAGADFATLD